MPLIIPLTYFFLLPRYSDFSQSTLPSSYEDDSTSAAASTAYTSLPTMDNQDNESQLPDISDIDPLVKSNIALSAADKWRLVKPLLPKYMLPLCEITSRFSDM